MARMNNLSARLKCNEILVTMGHEPLPSVLLYEKFAYLLRQIMAPKMHGVAFASREDAVAYIRLVASGGINSERS
jgi:hypothetical protein